MKDLGYMSSKKNSKTINFDEGDVMAKAKGRDYGSNIQPF